jgi:hypothetical protein
MKRSTAIWDMVLNWNISIIESYSTFLFYLYLMCSKNVDIECLRGDIALVFS